MKPAIHVDGLSKRYRLGTARGDNNLTENLKAGFVGAWRGLTGGQKAARTNNGEFWALRDVTFEVDPGEVVGIIGHNGAGKSTLLKVLSRIVEPTSGQATVRGRMGSLLEVGTGFHPELTGRENIYLNGSILGMRHSEIARKFDEIVAFSEVEKFLDTPVKRYSSGMYVRLAFSVAAHLEPEILIVDEVLAVGDATFQRRCIDRMSELARSGRTILFVSHNMQLVSLLCKQAVLLERGHVARFGRTNEVTRDYLSGLAESARSGDLRDKPRRGDGRARFVRAWLVDRNGEPAVRFNSGDDLWFRLEIESSVGATGVGAAVAVATQHGTRVVTSWTQEVGYELTLHPGRQTLDCRFKHVALRPGHTVMAHLWLWEREVMDFVENALVIDVGRAAGQDHLSPDAEQGIVLCDYEWSSGTAQ